MTIRLATLEDIPDLLRMGKSFFDSSGYGEYGEYDEEYTRELLARIIPQGDVITDGKSGMLGFILYPLYMSPGVILAQELFWWVDSEKRGTTLGIRMLQYFEKVAKQRRASAITMISLSHGDHGPKTAQLYQRLGYKLKEQSFFKSL